MLFYAAISVDVTRMILSGEKKYRGTLQTYAHVSKPVEMRILEKTIRSIESGGVPKCRALNSDKWKVTRHEKIAGKEDK